MKYFAINQIGAVESGFVRHLMLCICRGGRHLAGREGNLSMVEAKRLRGVSMRLCCEWQGPGGPGGFPS